jgi:intermediate cleaving peptidase 55
VEAKELTFGQPLHETHPHLLRAGECTFTQSRFPYISGADLDPVTPGITAIEYYKRRQALAELLPKNSIAIIPAGDIKYRPGSSAVFYDFHQDPDFHYLTGTSDLHRSRQTSKADLLT